MKIQAIHYPFYPQIMHIPKPQIQTPEHSKDKNETQRSLLTVRSNQIYPLNSVDLTSISSELPERKYIHNLRYMGTEEDYS